MSKHGISMKRSLAWMGGASLIGQVITWSITIVVARLLTPEDYGLVAISGLFTAFANSICLMGVSSAVVQADEVSEYQIKALYGLSIIMGVGMFGLGLLAAPVVAWGFDDPRLTALVSYQNLVFLFGAPKSLHWSLLARETRFDVIAKVETISRILTSACALAMAAAGFGVWTLATQWILLEVFQFIGFSLYRHLMPTFVIRWTEIRDLLLFGVKIFVRNTIGQLYASVDVFIFGKFASAGFLGAYTFSKQLTNMPFEKIITIINRVLLPYMCKDKGDPGSMRQWTLKMGDFQSLLLAPCFYMLFFCADEVVFILLGAGWSAAVLPLKIFSLANLFKLAENYSMIALTALGKVTEQVYYAVIQLVFIGGGILALVVWQNVETSLLVWVTLFPALTLLYSRILLRSIGLGFWTVITHLKGILLAHICMLASLFAVATFIHGALWQTLLIKIGVGGTVYLVSLFLLDREKMFMVLKLLPLRRNRVQESNV